MIMRVICSFTYKINTYLETIDQPGPYDFLDKKFLYNFKFILNFTINEILSLKVRIYCLQTYIKCLCPLYCIDKENKTRSHRSSK